MKTRPGTKTTIKRKLQVVFWILFILALLAWVAIKSYFIVEHFMK